MATDAYDRPRKFFLVSTFFVDDVDTTGRSGFQLRASGSEGQIFRPFPRIDELSWFEDFKRSQGNVAFGLQSISDPEVISGLKEVADNVSGSSIPPPIELTQYKGFAG